LIGVFDKTLLEQTEGATNFSSLQGQTGPAIITPNQPTAPVSAVPVPNQPTLSTDPTSNQPAQQLSAGPASTPLTVHVTQLPTPNQATEQPSVGAASTPIVVNVKQPAPITDPNQPAATPFVVHVTQLPTPTAPPVMGRSIDVSAQPGTQINVDPNATTNQSAQSALSASGSDSITNQQTGTVQNTTQGQLNITGPTQTRPTQIEVTTVGDASKGLDQVSGNQAARDEIQYYNADGTRNDPGLDTRDKVLDTGNFTLIHHDAVTGSYEPVFTQSSNFNPVSVTNPVAPAPTLGTSPPAKLNPYNTDLGLDK